MHKELKELWVKALRSGNYKPNKTCYLADAGDRWNPSGVLIDVGFETTWAFDEDFDRWTCEGATVYMPMWYAAMAGLPFADELKILAMHINGKTFKQIADWIERNL